MPLRRKKNHRNQKPKKKTSNVGTHENVVYQVFTQTQCSKSETMCKNKIREITQNRKIAEKFVKSHKMEK